MNLIQQLEQEEIARLNKQIPEFAPGDTVVVSVRVVEGNRSRLQAYEGVVIARRNRGLNSNFIVRKISSGEGVERTFQLYSPNVEKNRSETPRRRAPCQAVLPARPHRQSCTHQRKTARPQRLSPAAAQTNTRHTGGYFVAAPLYSGLNYSGLNLSRISSFFRRLRTFAKSV